MTEQLGMLWTAINMFAFAMCTKNSCTCEIPSGPNKTQVQTEECRQANTHADNETLKSWETTTKTSVLIPPPSLTNKHINRQEVCYFVLQILAFFFFFAFFFFLFFSFFFFSLFLFFSFFLLLLLQKKKKKKKKKTVLIPPPSLTNIDKACHFVQQMLAFKKKDFLKSFNIITPSNLPTHQ